MKIGNYKKLLKQRKINYTPRKLLEPVIILSFTSCLALEITRRKKAPQLKLINLLEQFLLTLIPSAQQ